MWPPVGFARIGGARRLTPVSRIFGGDRGQPIDRYYIERFLTGHAGKEGYVVGDIRGRVLEIGEDSYTRRFGGWGGTGPTAVERVDVLHADESNPAATIVGDLRSGENIPSNSYDCVICTQTLHLIYDVHAAVATLHRILTPGGVVLATVPGISQICRPDADLWGDHWRFTTRSARRLFEGLFPAENVRVEAHGNVLAATAFLWGMAAEEMKEHELEMHDPDYELLITIRAQKAGI